MKLEPHVESLLEQRYYKPGEDWPALVDRVVNYVCEGESEEYKEIVRNHLLNRIWLPNSPCLVGSGTKMGGLFACFVVGPDEDTLENHVEVLGDIAAVGKRGGGCGFSGTMIRHEGAPVAGSAHSSAYGPNNWAVRVSEYLDMITQGHFRKMALMYSLRSDHPDLEKFIDLKQTNNERFGYNFNQSIMATDEWMTRAISNKESEEHRLLKKVAQNAWNNGDPGLLFFDTINNKTPYKLIGETINTTNPCQPGFAPVHTADYRYTTIDKLNIGDYIWSQDGWVEVVRKIGMGIKPVYRYITENGDFIGTSDHKVYAMIRHDGSVEEMSINNAYEMEHLCPCLESQCEKVTYEFIQERQFLGEFEVYSITVDGESHSYWTGGISAQNCGEQPIPSYASCNLGSINIAHDSFFNEDGSYNFISLEYVAATLARFLDNVGSKNIFPNDKFKKWYDDHRPIGVGIMGYADALLKLEIRYGSQRAADFLEQIAKHIYRSVRDESVRLGAEKGIPSKCGIFGRRNITLTSIAPTGSIGFIANCSHGIEPIFSPVYNRIDERGESYLFKHPLRDKEYFMSAINDSPLKTPLPVEHVNTQAIVQKWVDSAVSKTINLPYEATAEDIYEIMAYAWKSECKGITVYRDGSRNFQVLNEVREEDQMALDCVNGVCEL